MRKLISVVFLALMALIQVHAQGSDLRSAPDLPTFKVTLGYDQPTATEQGAITATDAADVTIATGTKLVYGSTVKFTVTAKSGYVLDQLTVNNAAATTTEGSFDANTKNTTYTYSIASLTRQTNVSATFKAKEVVTVTVDKLSATKNEITAGTQPTVTFTPVITGQTVQFKDASGALTDRVPAQEGAYTIVITSPETATHAALSDETRTFNVTAAQVLNFSVDNAQAGSVKAKFDTDVTSGVEIPNGQSAMFDITANSGYKLSGITVNGTAETTLPAGTLNGNTTVYHFQTANLTSTTDVIFSFATKDTVKVSVEGATASKAMIEAGVGLPKVTVTPVLAGQAIVYVGEDSKTYDKIPAIIGTYTIKVTSPETLQYGYLENTQYKFAVTEAEVLSFNVDSAAHASVKATIESAEVQNGGAIKYGKPATLVLTTQSGWKLDSIKVNGEAVAVANLPAGTVNAADHTTAYTFTTANLTASTDVAFMLATKDTVRFAIDRFSATEGEGTQPKVTFTPAFDGQKVVFVNGTTETATVPATIGSYVIKVTSPETLAYGYLENTDNKFVVESKKEVGALTLPTAGRIEEGEPLSMAVLKGGSAEGTTGSFVWTNPNDTASLDETTYGVTFLPEDPVHFLAKDTFINNVVVTPVYTMKVEAGNFGTVVLTGRSANDRYAEGYQLEAEAIANKNYMFAGWSDGNTSATRTLTAAEDLELTARFDSILHKATINEPTNGTLKVYANGVEVQNGASLLQGTLLTINATPDANFMVKSVKVNGALVNTGSYVLAEAATIEAAFEEKPAATHLVNVSELKHGSVTLLQQGTDEAWSPITPGVAVAENTKVKVIGKADYGYAQGTVTVEGATYSDADSTFTVGTADAKVTVNFDLAKFAVTTAANIQSAGSVSLKTLEGTAVTSPVDYQTKLVASVTTNSGYRFKSLIANSSEIKDGDTLVVSGPMTITANYIEKTTLEINTTQQTLVYNKNPRAYEVKVKGGHAAKGFTVTYNTANGEMPTNAGTYTVTITRPEDELYKAVNATATLVIKKAGMAVKSIALGENNEVTADLTQDYAKAEWNPSTTQLLRAAATGTPTEGQVNVIRFTPVDATNYEPVDYYMPVGTVDQVTLTTSNTQVTNGGLEVTATEIAKGTKLTLKAIAPEGQRFVKWNDGDTNIEREVTLTADATYTPEFTALKTFSIKTREFKKTYDGSIQVVALTDLFNETDLPEGIVLKYTNTDGSSATPVNAGTYMVNVSFAGNDEWTEFYDVNIKLTIDPAEIGTFTAPTASELTEGQPLSASILSGGVAKVSTSDATAISGIFEWAEPSMIPGVGEDQANKVNFKSYDPNYTSKDEAASANVTVKSNGIPVITFEQPENATVKVYTEIEGEKTEIASGTAVAPGSKLIVEVTPDSGYELESLKIGETNYTSGTVTIDDVQGSLAIIATVKASAPVIPEAPAATGVKLDITSKSIAIGESFTLKATVSPSDALQYVEWSSSDETIATVDEDGIVTALAVGTCTITATTENGKTAVCEVSVSTTVSIEQIAEGMNLYGTRGAVVIEPSTPVSIRVFAVTGACLYSGRVTDITRVPASAGIYLIEVSASGQHAVKKVSVR